MEILGFFLNFIYFPIWLKHDAVYIEYFVTILFNVFFCFPNILHIDGNKLTVAIRSFIIYSQHNNVAYFFNSALKQPHARPSRYVVIAKCSVFFRVFFWSISSASTVQPINEPSQYAAATVTAGQKVFRRFQILTWPYIFIVQFEKISCRLVLGFFSKYFQRLNLCMFRLFPPITNNSFCINCFDLP